ncbi:hypothetical protein P9112_011287 [Eukaryota sp. TZLM1-RC]
MSILRFSSSGSVLCAIDDTLLTVFLCSPFEKRIERTFSAPLGLVDVLGTSNCWALVGSSPSDTSSLFHDHKVVIWDDRECQCLCEIGSSSKILNIAFLSDCIVVLSENEVFVTNIHSLSRTSIELKPSSSLLGVSSLLSSSVFAFPCTAHQSSSSSRASSHQGFLAIADPAPSSPHCSIIPAHKTPLSAIALSSDGSLAATASSEGTLIRVWSSSGSMISEFRRGTRKATITSLAFGGTKFVAIASKKETVHVFSLAGKHLSFDTKSKVAKFLNFDVSGELLFVVGQDRTFRTLSVKDSELVEVDRTNF